MNKFLTLGLSQWITETLKAQGISEPTPIQEKAIPFLLDGNDLIAQSQTGTGKTFAFALPILEKIDAQNPSIQALIVTPTRELALQITDEFSKLVQNKEGVNILAVYGGQDVEAQLKKLKKGIQIVIGTPGRLLDHIRRETVDFSKVNFLVLDEADQMLHIGFLDEVEKIIERTPKTRQTLLFSATMPEEIKRMGKRHTVKPHYLQIEQNQAPLANIKQIAITTTDRAKQNDLIESLRMYQPFLGVIFCRTKRRAGKLNEILKANHFNCDELHGDLSQSKREQVMKKFREAKIQFLIATDVAARGLDVEGVTHVFNYDIPLDTESYIHRIGRTGRAGNDGLAVTFYSAKDRPLLEKIEADLQLRIEKKDLGNGGKEETRSNGSKNAGSSQRGEYKGKYTRKPDARNDNTRNRKKPDQSPQSKHSRLQGAEGTRVGITRKDRENTVQDRKQAGRSKTQRELTGKKDSRRVASPAPESRLGRKATAGKQNSRNSKMTNKRTRNKH